MTYLAFTAHKPADSSGLQQVIQSSQLTNSNRWFSGTVPASHVDGSGFDSWLKANICASDSICWYAFGAKVVKAKWYLMSLFTHWGSAHFLLADLEPVKGGISKYRTRDQCTNLTWMTINTLQNTTCPTSTVHPCNVRYNTRPSMVYTMLWSGYSTEESNWKKLI